MDHTPSGLQVLHRDVNDMFVNLTVLAADVCEHTVCFHCYKHLHSHHESRYFTDGKHVKFNKCSKQELLKAAPLLSMEKTSRLP